MYAYLLAWENGSETLKKKKRLDCGAFIVIACINFLGVL